MTTGTGGEQKRPTGLDKLRWTLVGLTVVGALVIVSLTYVGDGICRQVAVQTAAVRVCGPFGLDDTPWLGLVVLVVFLLLLPDVSEVSVAGLGSLKRIVQEQQKKVEEQEKKTAELERLVVTQLVALSVNSTMTQSNTFVVTPGGIRKARDISVEEPEKLRTQARAGVPSAAPSPTRAVLQARVLELWEDVATVFTNETGGERRRAWLPDPEGRVLIDHPRLLAWYRDFSGPFNTFRAVRNAVAHPPNDLSNEDLRAAIELGENLLKSLNDTVSGTGP